MVNIYIEIITNLINLIQFLLSVVIVKKFSYKYDKPVRKEYRKLKVDSLPLIEKFQPVDYNKLLNDCFVTHGKHLKPVKHRSKNVPDSVCCPRCNAPHTYIYDNNGGKGQFLCKVCKTAFFPNRKFKSVIFKCPHCCFCNFVCCLF